MFRPQQENGNWARSNIEKTQVFAEHLGRTFMLLNDLDDDEVNIFLDAPCQLSPPARSISPSEVKRGRER